MNAIEITSRLNTSPQIDVRDARKEYVPTLTRVYAQHIANGAASLEKVLSHDEPKQRRNCIPALGLQYIVAGSANGQILGFSHATRHVRRRAYRLENSAADPGPRLRGVGSTLPSALIPRCEANHWRPVTAVTDDSNARSIMVPCAIGGNHDGTLSQVPDEFSRWLGIDPTKRAVHDGDLSSSANEANQS